MVIFHSYVSLPEGKIQNEVQSKNSHFVLPSSPRKTEEDFQCNGTLVAASGSQWPPANLDKQNKTNYQRLR